MMQENYICVSPCRSFPYVGYHYHIEDFKPGIYKKAYINSVCIHRICFLVWKDNKVKLDITKYKFVIRFDTVTNEYSITMFSNYGDAESIHFESRKGRSKLLISVLRKIVYDKFYKVQTINRDMRIAHEWLFDDGSSTINLDLSIRHIYQYDMRPTV